MKPINISTHTAIFAWKPACWLHVSGDDAANFLQGQFTNDLRGLAIGGAVYGLWLTLKGKVLGDSFVLRGRAPNEFWIGSYHSSAALIRERLESHVIADDVTIADETSEWTGISILGEGASALLAASASDDAFVFRGRRERGESVECVHRVAKGTPTSLATLPAAQLDLEEVERRRIAAGIPAIPIDLGLGDLPNEGGLEADAISYTKGCYLGQEVMARLKSMGQVRRRLVRVAGHGEISRRTLPAGVFAGSRQVGELRSAIADGNGGWIGLAMLSLLHVKPETPLGFGAEEAPNVRLLDLP